MHIRIPLLMAATTFASARRCFVGAFTNTPCYRSASTLFPAAESSLSRRLSTKRTSFRSGISSCTLRRRDKSSAVSRITAFSSMTPPHSSFGSSTVANKESKEQPASLSDSREWSPYEQLVRKLYMTNLFNPVKLGLENMNRLHEALGRPMDQPNVSIVHIAGSNGKGSVALKTANTLSSTHNNYKVGLFVSPHISSFRERIQINGTPVSEDRVVQHLSEIFDLCDEESIPATFFEVTTALAFRVFHAEGVNVVVLETGLGGRLDATNVIRRPAVCVITSIGLEHTRILGDTVEKIAAEKAGIIKEGCPVLIGRSVPEEVVREIAAEKKAAQVYKCEELLGSVDDESEIIIRDYDVENSRMSKAALILLQFHLAEQSVQRGEQAHVITPDEIEEGVKIRPPCRFEEMDIAVVPQDGDNDGDTKNTITTKAATVRVILDVAHNPQAMEYLIFKLTETYPNLDPTKNVRMIVGMSADKDLKQCTDRLLAYLGVDNVAKLHLVAASHPRAASVNGMLEANPILKDAHYCNSNLGDEDSNNDSTSSDVATQVRAALNLAACNNEILVICGSVFIMADAREQLGIIEPRDSAVIAEVAGAGMRSSQENFGDANNKIKLS